MKKMLALMTAGVLAVSVLAGCGKDNNAGSTAPGNAQETKEGGSAEGTTQAQKQEDVYKSVRLGVGYDPTTFDYAELNLDSATIATNLVGEALLRNENGTMVAGCAESWESNDDSTEWTFRLRKGMTYSDGTTPITAEDFYYAYTRLIDPAAGHGNAYFDLYNSTEYYNGECGIEDLGIEVVDEYTIKYKFYYPTYEVSFADRAFMPLEQAFVEASGANYGSSVETFLGNGPYKLAEWVMDSSFKLVKNEHHFNADAFYMDEFDFVIGATNDVGVDMMLAGELDLTLVSNKNQINTVSNAGFDIYSFTSSYYGMNINHKGKSDATGEFLGNANFRKAINYAINRDALAASVMTGAEPAYRMTAPSEAVFKTDPDYQAWPTSGDAELAKEYLNKALEELGKTIEEVPEIELLCYESQSALEVLSAVQDMVRQTLGIEMKINPQTIQVMISSAMSGDYDLWLGGNSIGVPDALSGFLAGYYTPNYSPLRGYSNEEFDKLYLAAMSSPTLDDRYQAYTKLEEYFCDNVLLYVFGWSQSYYVYDADKYTGLYSNTDIDLAYLNYK